ncbi:hypothetical protein L7F22_022772 [Adiantum nelumboides]|nr:hypothetical protein [Adiantum nelumboides]
MSGEDEGRQPPQHPYWTRLRQSFGQGGESSSAIEEEEEANQPTPESQYSSSSSDTEDFEQVPEEVPNLEQHRGRIPERMQQRGNAPGVDAVIPGGNQVRQSNYKNWNNQGPNQRLQAQAAGWNNQRNQARDGGNHPCTYCGISGHRQGPECPLWCKHRSERGIPIVQYNNRGNQPQQRPPAQLNAVILEEVEPEQPEDYLKTIQQESDDILRADKDCCSKGKTSKHFQCDCTECISIEEVPDDQKIPETMAVTRSGKKKEVHVQEKGEQQPMDWSAQDQIRMGVLKEINSANKQKEETRRSTLPYAGTNQKKIGWKEPVAVDQEQVKKREEAERMSEEFFEALMNAPTQISLRQILGLVPSFADKFMQKFQNQYGIRKISDVRQEADLVQEPEWAENQERLQQIKWFLERVMLLVKLDYISRENYAILSWAEKGRRFGWATMLYERIHSEIFSKEKKRVQRSTKVGPLITAIYMHVRNNAVLRALNPSGSHQAADRQEEDIQEGCSQPIGVRKAAQEAKQKMLDQQGGAAELYRSLLSAGYSHEECMETVVKKPIRLRKRKVESVAGQEPELTQQGQDTGPVQEKEQVFQDISFARVLEASSLIKEYMDQQHLNNAVLVNGNSKLKAKEEKLDFYQKQLSRRVSTAQMYKKWQEEWSAILNKEFDMLFATNARLEADNKVLLNRVTACKEVEEKIRDCTDEELVIDGWYLPAQEVDDMKAELRRQGEQIWMNFGKKMEEVISKPYQIFAKEENNEELLLLQSQLEDLQGKFNFLQEQQSEKEHKKADDSQVDEEFNVKGKRSAVEKFCFDEEPVQQTGEEYESSDLHTLISKIAGDLEKPVKSLEILSDVVITSENVDDKEQDEKQDDVVKEKDELLVDVQNIKEQETVAEQQQDVVMEAVGDVQAIQDVVLYDAEKKDAD